MAEAIKYDILLNELSSMETQVLVLTNKWRDTFQRNKALEDQFNKFKRDNLDLLQRISNLEEELEKFQNDGDGNLFNSLNLKERETLKVKLQNLISKIDYHLSVERQA